MTRAKRRLLWVLGLAILALIAVGAYLYYIGTRTMLEQAEALALSRLRVAQQGDDNHYRFFYVSNRVPKDTGAMLDRRFLDERRPEIELGSFDIRVEPSVGLGMLIDADLWFVNEQIKLLAVEPVERDAFVADLRAQVEASPYRSVLVVIQGYRETFAGALRKGTFAANVLDIDTPMLVFDWPGNQGDSLVGYRRARQVAEASGAELAATLRLLVDKVQPERVWVLANSLGGQVVADAFHVLAQDPAWADGVSEIDEVALTAPDIGRDEFTERFKDEIKALAQNLTLYVSSNDRALLVSRLINREHRLGESTFDPRDLDQVQVAASFADLLEPGEERLALVDVTPVNRTRNFHNFGLETPEFYDDLFERLTDSELPRSRRLYFVETEAGRRYFILTRGR